MNKLNKNEKKKYIIEIFDFIERGGNLWKVDYKNI